MGTAPGIPTTAIRQTENALVDLLGFTVRDVLRSPIASERARHAPASPAPPHHPQRRSCGRDVCLRLCGINLDGTRPIDGRPLLHGRTGRAGTRGLQPEL